MSRQLETGLIATLILAGFPNFRSRKIGSSAENCRTSCARSNETCGTKERIELWRNLRERSHLSAVRFKRSVGCSPKSGWPSIQQRAASPGSEPTARSDEAAKTPSVLSGFRMVCPFARRIFRSPGKKVRAYFLPRMPNQGNASRLRRACTWSSLANHAA